MIVREATPEDVAALVAARDADVGTPADRRMGPYLEGRHHPHKALAPRVIFVAIDGPEVLGYIGGHLTERYACDGELQYLWVTSSRRREGVATGMLARLADWFLAQRARRICVDVEPLNATARAFYARHGAEELNEHWMVWADIDGSSA